MDSRHQTGKKGEDLAVRFLENNGYHILMRNFRIRRGEIDIIARDGKTIVFIEVKTQAHRGFGDPLEWVDHKKQINMNRAAEMYLHLNHIEADCRFDVITLKKCSDGFQIMHIPDAFQG